MTTKFNLRNYRVSHFFFYHKYFLIHNLFPLPKKYTFCNFCSLFAALVLVIIYN